MARRLKLGAEKDKVSAIATLKTGKNTEFWGLIEQALDESIDYLEKLHDSDDLKEYAPDRYKLESELIKAKKIYLKRLKEYPTILINKLQDEDFDNFDFDPYEKVVDED